MELGDFTYIAGVLLVLLTVFVFGWLVVWRVVLSQFPQFREALKDIFGLGDNEQKKKARELRRQRRDSRSEQRKRALRTAKELQEAVLKEKQLAAAASFNTNVSSSKKRA